MPYIKVKQRETLDNAIDELISQLDIEFQANRKNLPGQLNYAITRLIKHFYVDEGQSYSGYNDAIGMLHCCAAEFYRVYVGPYEDTKRAENGPV